jgi:tetratricopeptide (TPR) repeat protein
MTCRHVFGCAAALVVLWVTSAAAQSSPDEVFQRKQAFVAAIRQFSISLTGRFGDEGHRLRSDLDAMESTLREWDQAIAAFEKALRTRTLDADAYIALGSVQLDRGRAQDAVRSFAAAVKLAPQNADGHRLLAFAYGLAGQPSDAVRALTRAATLRPDDVTVKYELARYAMESEATPRPAAVFTAFQDAAARWVASGGGALTFTRPGLLRQTAGVAPIFPPAPYVAGFDALMDGRFETAITECRKALAGDPLLRATGASDLVASGADALRRGDLAGALRQFNAAVAADPASSEAQRVLGTALRIDEQLEPSVAAYAAAVRLAPEDERARIGLSDVLIDLERFDEAEQTLRDAIRTSPAGVLGHYRLGRLLQARGKYAEALSALQTAARSTPLVGQDPLFEMVALLYANQTDFANAITALRRQVAVNPGNADAHRRLGDSYVRQGKPMEAQAEFTVAQLVDPRNVLASLGLAQLHLNSGSYADAARAARAAIALDPAQQQAHYVLATASSRLGQTEEAQKEIEEYRRLQAAAAEASRRKFERDGLARQVSVSLAAGDHEAAVSLLKQLISLEPDAAAHHLALGQALTAGGRTLDAIEAYRTAAQLDPSDPNVHRYLAEAYLAAGQTEAGRLEAARYRESVESAKRQRALRFGN